MSKHIKENLSQISFKMWLYCKLQILGSGMDENKTKRPLKNVSTVNCKYFGVIGRTQGEMSQASSELSITIVD